MRPTVPPNEAPSPFRLTLLDVLLLAAAVGCLVAIVVPDRANQLLKAALAFWGGACIAGVGVNIALRAALEATALRRRMRHIEDQVDDLRRDLERALRALGEQPATRPRTPGE
jgi:hypothetical protein